MAMDLDGRTNEFVDQFSLCGADAAKADGILAFRDGYKKAIADAAAVARAHAFVEESADDTMQGIRRGEPYRKLAAAIESLLTPKSE